MMTNDDKTLQNRAAIKCCAFNLKNYLVSMDYTLVTAQQRLEK